MAVRSDQSRPLAPAAIYGVSSDHDQYSPMSMEFFKGENKLHRRKCLVKCCGCITALFLILAVLALVLMFTVFHIKTPKIKIDTITIHNLKVENGSLVTTDSNITLMADVSVKNPNYVSFWFDNTTTTVYYHGVSIGEGWTWRGHVEARKTKVTNVTIDIYANEILRVPNLSRDASSGEMNFSSYTKIIGRFNVIKTVHKHLVVNCTMTVNLTSLEVHNKNCNRHVSLVEG